MIYLKDKIKRIWLTNNIYDRGNCDGPQLLYELRNCNIKIPVIVLTVSHNKRAEFLNEGFNEYMTKLLDQEKVKEGLWNVRREKTWKWHPGHT